WYLRELELDASGRIDMEAGQGLIALAHQLAGLVVAGLVIALGVAGLRAGQAAAAWSRALLGLVGVQVALGLSLVYAGLPLLVVLGHNLVAALLLLVCLRLVISNSSPSRS
ncbi:MAG: hypothetical protein EP301_04925, partial [Gammaproteobacteria bacterium]